MTYEIRYSPAALQDLLKVRDDVFDVSSDPLTTDRYMEDRIPLYYGGLFTGFYSVNFKAYKVFYRVRGQWIEVLRILPAASEYLKILF